MLVALLGAVALCRAQSLFISEYLEGGSLNKALELFNPFAEPVALAGYTVRFAPNNGGEWSDQNVVALSGVLGSRETFVLVGSGCALCVAGDVTLESTFNGNDAVGLFGPGGELLDGFGAPGAAQWAVAGVSNAAKDHTVRRKASVFEGETDWELSRGTTADNSQWIVLDKDDFGGLGEHTFDGLPEVILLSNASAEYWAAAPFAPTPDAASFGALGAYLNATANATAPEALFGLENTTLYLDAAVNASRDVVEEAWPGSPFDLHTSFLAQPDAVVGRRGRRFGAEPAGFEPPVRARGDLARAMFYAATRYPGAVRLVDWVPVSETQMGPFGLLQLWAGQDPVDSEEVRRADRAAALQGSRNAFVEYPDLRELLANEVVAAALPPTILAPDSREQWPADTEPDFTIRFVLPQAAVPGSVRVAFEPDLELFEADAATLVLAPEYAAAGEYTVNVTGGLLANSSNVTEVIGGGVHGILTFGGFYRVVVSYDPAGVLPQPAPFAELERFRYGIFVPNYAAVVVPPPAEYYEDVVAAFGTSGFRSALVARMSEPHSAVPLYEDTDEAMIYTDADPETPGSVILLYTRASSPGAAFSNEAVYGPGVAWNREHVWPRSRGIEDTGPDNVDLHHLFPSNARVNNARSNLYFDEVDVLDDGYVAPGSEFAPGSERSSVAWEPPGGVKGDIARAVMYMHVRYNGGAENATSQLQMTIDAPDPSRPELGLVDVLLAWHEQDPVDDWELARTERVQQVQGNRNPFVDHPEWARYALGTAGPAPPSVMAPAAAATVEDVVPFEFVLPEQAVDGSVIVSMWPDAGGAATVTEVLATNATGVYRGELTGLARGLYFFRAEYVSVATGRARAEEPWVFVNATATESASASASAPAPDTATRSAAPDTETRSATPFTATRSAAPDTETRSATPFTATRSAAPDTETRSATPLTATRSAAPDTETRSPSSSHSFSVSLLPAPQPSGGGGSKDRDSNTMLYTSAGVTCALLAGAGVVYMRKFKRPDLGRPPVELDDV